MPNKPPMIKGPDIYIGGKPKHKQRSWEAKELGDINRNWQRGVGTREHARQMSVKRVSMKANRRSMKRSEKGT